MTHAGGRVKGEGWRRFKQALREGDFRGAAILAGRGVVVVRHERMIVIASLALDAVRKLPESSTSPTGLVVREASGEDLPQIIRLFPHGKGRYADRMRRGDECLLVLTGNEIIGMTWIGFDPHAPRELGCPIHLPDASCWEYDIFVLAGHRKQGAFSRLMEGMFQRLSARGVRRVFAAVSHLNGVSLAAHSRMGYTTAGVIDRFELLGTPFWRTTDAEGRTAWGRGRGGRGPTLNPGGGRNS